MLVVKKMGAWVTHMRKSVRARFIINKLAGVLRVRLLHIHVHTYKHKTINCSFLCSLGRFY